LVIGRVIIDYRQRENFFGALRPGIIKEEVEVEVESWDRSRRFSVRTDDEGYFFIPNIPRNTYHVRRVTIKQAPGAPERQGGASLRRLQLGVGTLTFTPVPGKIAYVGTALVVVNERGFTDVREMRDAHHARDHFVRKWSDTEWVWRELVSVGAKPVAGQAAAQQAAEGKPLAATALKAERPGWKIGYEWKYAWKAAGRSGTVTTELVREESLAGVPSYVLRTGKEEQFYTKEALGLLATMSGGKLVLKREPPDARFSWPLVVGKEWRSSYLLENIAERSTEKFDYRMVVSGVEVVKVPAGTFAAFKIELYYGSDLLFEYWYSPKAKWFVKIKTYPSGGMREWELISFKAD
jgi:hypothetical protein